VAAELKTQGRVIASDPEPRQGSFHRSDHISLANVGIPMIDPDGGFDLVNCGRPAGQAVRVDSREHHYHQPSVVELVSGQRVSRDQG
jgi:uncharacterized protein (UPF0261 family)